MSLDFSLARLKPYDHQIIGTEAIVCWDDRKIGRIIGGVFFLMDEMGAGKTKQTIDAAQFLYRAGAVNRVIIVAPAAVRPVWFDPELGELAKHLWETIPNRVAEYHGKIRSWSFGPESKEQLRWIVTNFDFIRDKDRLSKLAGYCGPKTMLVVDESSAIKSYKAKQTKSVLALRKRCGRVLLLNGTPIANSPGDIYSQAHVMSPDILGCKNYFHFRARYALLGGWQQKQIVGWRDLDDLQKRLAPYVLRRLKTDCLDLPAKLEPVALTCPLSEKSWGIYKEMRDELVAWLSSQVASISSQAAVRAMRLAQITSGFLGGLQEVIEEEAVDLSRNTARPSFIPTVEEGLEEVEIPRSLFPVGFRKLHDTKIVGSEKLDLFLEWFGEQLDQDPGLKLLVWCRFRPELVRLRDVLLSRPEIVTGTIWGGQSKEDREFALRILDPRTMPKKPVVVIGTPASGSLGLNLTGAHTVIYMSNDYSLKVRLQSEDRVHRPGQTNPVSYFDVVATGPKGQKTIDHTILKALRRKEDLATITTRDWVSRLIEDSEERIF